MKQERRKARSKRNDQQKEREGGTLSGQVVIRDEESVEAGMPRGEER